MFTDAERAATRTLSDLHAADPMLPANARVIARRDENQDTFSITLEACHGDGLWHFRPGQFCMLYAFGHGEVPISISGDPQRAAGFVHTIRAVGSVTRALQALQEGDCLGIRGPFGSVWPVDEACGADLVIVAGGIGLAPLRPLIYEVCRRRAEFGRVQVFYGARSPEDLLFVDEFEAWGRESAIDIFLTVDHSGHAWYGQVGVVCDLLPKFDGDSKNSLAFLCGPEIMMRFTIRKLNELGICDDRIFVSMERNMQCAIGLCGHCQFGPSFICKDGPVFRFDKILELFRLREL